jgi:hypothetical protein
MDNATRVRCGLVDASLLVPDPATMKERQTIADVDDCLQDYLIWNWQMPSAPAAL